MTTITNNKRTSVKLARFIIVAFVFSLAACSAFAQRRERHEHGVEKEAEPRAFAATCLAHSVQAVVPVAATHEREPVGTGRDALLDGPDAVIEH